MCGIVGIVGQQNANQQLYDALTVLQHRGQDAAGITTFTDSFHVKKGPGLVLEIFDEKNAMAGTTNAAVSTQNRMLMPSALGTPQSATSQKVGSQSRLDTGSSTVRRFPPSTAGQRTNSGTGVRVKELTEA